MRLAIIALVIVMTAGALHWMRGGAGGHIAKALPFCSGDKPSFYDVAALAIIGIALAAIARPRGKPQEEDQFEVEESPEADDTESTDPQQEAQDEDSSEDEGY
jgi:hypothetical protein